MFTPPIRNASPFSHLLRTVFYEPPSHPTTLYIHWTNQSSHPSKPLYYVQHGDQCLRESWLSFRPLLLSGHAWVARPTRKKGVCGLVQSSGKVVDPSARACKCLLTCQLFLRAGSHLGLSLDKPVLFSAAISVSLHNYVLCLISLFLPDL